MRFPPTLAGHSRWFAATAMLCMLGAAAPPSAVTREQIEADWVRQDVVRHAATVNGEKVAPEQDAAGGVDGVKTGKWGFHTLYEEQPWWQVDLGKSMPIDRVLLYNRCDGNFARRNGRIILLLSENGKDFRPAYRHDGSVFLGKPDAKPLTVSLGGRPARFVRLQLPGKAYLHLDEVEVYATGSQNNIALHCPALQSSSSQWSVRHDLVGQPTPPQPFYTAEALQRGIELARNLSQLGVDTAAEQGLFRQLAERLGQLPDNTSRSARQQLDHRVRWTVRKLALKTPLLDFDEILFIKRAPGLFPHVCDQYYGWWSRGGGGVCILAGFKGQCPTVRCLTQDWPVGSFLRPDLSYDGKRVLFAWCRHYPHIAAMDKVDKDTLPEDSFYHLYEMNIDGTGVRQLTRGRYDDFDGRYLADGKIVFLSTRKGQALQTNKNSVVATTMATCPDSYVRCGGGNHRPVAVFTLHVMDGSGSDLRPASAFENFEWTPALASDGRILYARWDYIDRFNGHFMSLWSTNPDGTNAQLVYGNYTKRPQCIFEARSIPDSSKLIFTATAHHSITGGSLALLDPNAGTEYDRPITRLTPEVVFPETEGWPECYYAGPWPLSEEYFLVSWSDRRLPPHRLMPPDDSRNPPNALGIYLYDAFGNLTLLHRDPQISSMNPIPVRPRRRPPARTDTVAWNGREEGRFLVQDVYRGLEGVARGRVKQLRIVAVPPKVQPQMNQPVLGVSREDPGKFVLGTVPVESDGSAYFRVPSGMSLFFQALDRDGLAVQTMRSLTYVQPGQTLGCVGCHESRVTSPPAGTTPLAAQRPPSLLQPGPSGSWPLRFDELVQPVLNRRCVNCHRPGSEDAKAARFDLTPTRSYDSLLGYAGEDLKKLAFEKDQSETGDCPARRSKLTALLAGAKVHYDVRLSTEDWQRLATWMDTYAHRQGSFSTRQETQLRELRQKLAFLLEP